MVLPSAFDLVRDWTLDPGVLLLVAVLAIGYGRGVHRLAAHEHGWPRARTLSWASGLAVIVIATESGLATFDTTSFTAHMGEHVLLGVVAPVLLALGAPITLAFRASGRAQRRVLRGVLRSPVARLLGHPIVGWPLFGGTLVLLYFSPLLELQARNPTVHAVVHIHILVTGCLFVWPLIAVDPLPHRFPHGARLLAALAAVPFHAFLGIAMLAASSPLAAAYPSLTDQRDAAGLLWSSGELMTLVVTGIVFAHWFRADQRAGERGDAARRARAAITLAS